MNKSTFVKLCHEHSQKVIAKFMGVSKPMVCKYVKLKYAPPEWDYSLYMLSQGKYPIELFVRDRHIHNPNSKPMVNSSQVRKFLSSVGKKPTSKGKGAV